MKFPSAALWAVLAAAQWSAVTAFTTVTTRKQQFTSLHNAPENFADVAATIADAAGELSGKTIVVKYGGVR